MSTSTIYEMIIERGIEQGKELGAKAGTIQSILDLLDKRLEMSTAPILTPMLEPIDDSQLLRKLFHEAMEVDHLETFIRTIQTAQNGT